MLRLLTLMLLAMGIGMLVAPSVMIPAATWVLAFLSLLMAADLVLSSLRRRRRRGDGVEGGAR